MNAFDERLKTLETQMNERFGDRDGPSFYRAPGRVDVMGSHTDYNEGFILASTVDRDIVAAARKREGGVINLYSVDTDLEVRVNADHLKYDKTHEWANYPKGVIHELLELKAPFTGMDMVVSGEVPIGGNLSSSAALEAVTCEAALGLFDHEIPQWEKVQLCWRAESVFVGMPCGIMDQFTVIMGEEDKGLFLDCRTLDYETVPLAMEGVGLAVIGSGIGRELVSSKYSERVDECRAAVKKLKALGHKVKALRDADLDMVEGAKDELGDVLYRRAKHVVGENQRVADAAETLRSGDAKKLGLIMEAGYASCRDDYENSAPELDVLHDLALSAEGVLGVRIAGAGWGGALLALVLNDAIDSLESGIKEEYRKKTGNDCEVWPVRPSAGSGPL